MFFANNDILEAIIIEDTYKDKKGHLRWSASKKLVHKTVAKQSAGKVGNNTDGNKLKFRHSNLQTKNKSTHLKPQAQKRNSGLR